MSVNNKIITDILYTLDPFNPILEVEVEYADGSVYSIALVKLVNEDTNQEYNQEYLYNIAHNVAYNQGYILKDDWKSMYKERCQHCAYLIKDKEWKYDCFNKHCKNIRDCIALDIEN